MKLKAMFKTIVSKFKTGLVLEGNEGTRYVKCEETTFIASWFPVMSLSTSETQSYHSSESP